MMDITEVDRLDEEYRLDGIHKFLDEIPSDYVEVNSASELLRFLESNNGPQRNEANDRSIKINDRLLSSGGILDTPHQKR